MKSDLEKRLRALEEQKAADLSQRVDLTAYYLGTDHDEDELDQIYEDASGLVVFRNRDSGEVHGAFVDRRTEEEMIRDGGDPIWM